MSVNVDISISNYRDNSVINCLERLISEMTYYVSSGTLNSTKTQTPLQHAETLLQHAEAPVQHVKHDNNMLKHCCNMLKHCYNTLKHRYNM